MFIITTYLQISREKKGTMPVKQKTAIFLMAMSLSVATASAQLGAVVYDPTNYANALLRYFELQQQLLQLINTYQLAVQMAKNLENMPARYQALFSQWRNSAAQDTYGNTTPWITGINSGIGVNAGYQQATTPLQPYNPAVLAAMTPDELRRVESQYASVELSDGASETAMAAIGAMRNNAHNVEAQIANLEQDSLSGDADLNTEVTVLNKINAAGVLTLRTAQDSNKLLASLLEQQTLASKQQRDATTNTINADITRRATLAGNIAQITGTLTDSLQNFRMP
jgi:hypothetical protein